MQRSTQHPRRRAWLRRLIVVAVLAAAVGALLSQTVFAQTSYIITDGDRVTVHRSYSSDPYEVLTEAGIELEEEDTYETGYADGMNQITVRRMQMVTVINRGAQSVIGTYGETTGSLLARMGITPGAGDTLSCSSETQTYDGMTIELVHTETRIEEEDTTVPYPVNYYEDPDLEPDAEIVLVAGQNGLTHVKSEVTYRNGKEVSRVIVQETVQTKPVTQLVIRGVDRTIMEQPADPEPAPDAQPSGDEEAGPDAEQAPDEENVPAQTQTPDTVQPAPAEGTQTELSAQQGMPPRILGVTVTNPRAGSVVTATEPQKLDAALAVIAALDGTGILDHIVSINVEKEFDVVLQYDGRYEIRLGGTDDLAYKINYLTVILDRLSDFQAGTIDLTFTDSSEARFYSKE